MKKNYPTKHFKRTRSKVYDKLRFAFLTVLCSLSAGFYAQQTFTFTTCGASGRLGPSTSQMTLAYSTTNLNNSVTVSGGIQSFTVPQSGPYRITALGAQGGSNGSYYGGKGTSMRGEFFLTAGSVVKIIVAQAGESNSNGYNGGGGGASFVWISAPPSSPLIVAGGGGGAGSGYNGADAVITGSGTAGVGSTNGTPGTNGNGANPGGGGWLSAGQDFSSGVVCTVKCSGNATGVTIGGASPTTAIVYHGCAGTSDTGDGGFGGGSGGNGYCTTSFGGGGGGGYSGGVGQSGGNGIPAAGGGGGSYNGGTNQLNTASVNSGDGKVILEQLCNITMSVIGASSSGAICAGNSATLITNAVSNYSWSTGATTSSIVVSPVSTTSYSVSGTSTNACTSSAFLSITVNGSVPSLTISNSASATGGICPTKTVMLTASGAITYTWVGGSPTVTNGVAFAPSSTNDYTVTGENGCGTSTAVTTVSIHPLPSVVASASSPSLCSGSSLTLTGVGTATSYAWSGGSGGIVDGQGFSPATSANYTVVGTSSLGCQASATTSVTVVQTPSFAPTAGPALICIGNSSTLTATGAANYTWSGGSAVGSNSMYIVTPASPGITTYTVLRANSNCTTSAIVSVVTNSLPTVFAIANPTLVCAQSSASLAVAGGISYTWTSPGNPPSVPAFTFGVGNANPIVNPPVSTTYTVAATDGTCVNTTTVTVATNPIPTLVATASSSTICQGHTVSLSVTGGINYTWTATGSTNNTTTVTFTDSPMVSTAYNVVGDNSYGCTSSANQVVIVNTNPVVNASAVSNKTLACNGGTLTLTASGANTYSWSNGVTTQTAIVTVTNVTTGPVVFTVTGTNTLTQCFGTKTVVVGVFIPTLNVSGTPSTCPGGNITLSASGGNANTYTWTAAGSPTSQTGFSSITTTISGAGVFTVAAKTTSGVVICTSTQTVAVDLYANPTILATAQRTLICTKESVVLSASGGTAYSWNNGQITPTISVVPTSNTTYTVTGTDVNGCTGTGTVLVKLSGCAGITEQSAANAGLIIYPNPNSGEFFIKSNSDAKLTLVNELGQIVRTIILSGSNNYKVQVNDIAQGVYFLTGMKDGNQVNLKVVVNK